MPKETITSVAGTLKRRRAFTGLSWEDDDYDVQESCALEALVLLPIWVQLQKSLTKLGASVISHPGGHAILMKDGRVFTGIKPGSDGPELIEQHTMWKIGMNVVPE